MYNYEKHSHSHCFESENPPCGLKGKHRCCLCKEAVPSERDDRYDHPFISFTESGSGVKIVPDAPVCCLCSKPLYKGETYEHNGKEYCSFACVPSKPPTKWEEQVDILLAGFNFPHQLIKGLIRQVEQEAVERTKRELIEKHGLEDLY